MRRDPAPAGRLFERCLEGQKKQYLRAAATQQQIEHSNQSYGIYLNNLS
jgi:hypothetical protein